MKEAREPKYGGILIRTERVQIELKRLILRDLARGAPERETKDKARVLIEKFCSRVEEPALRERARASLARSFAKWYRGMAVVRATLPFFVLAQFRSVPQRVKETAIRRAMKSPLSARIVAEGKYFQPLEFGQEWHEAAYRKKMRDAFLRAEIRLADEDAKYSPRVSLRNLAEVEVRRAEIANELERLRNAGVRLVWVSSHADCSQRCAPWQGRLYSLDGTSGIEDGHRYIPIETAINVIDKYGNVNGLFGYNCRHRMTVYEAGSSAPRDYTVAQMKRERQIDDRQRAMERLVRKWKKRGYVLEKTDPAASAEAFRRGREWETRYKNYCLSNKRAYYEERVSLMSVEI